MSLIKYLKSKLLILIQIILFLSPAISLSWTEQESYILWSQFEKAQANWQAGNHTLAIFHFRQLEKASEYLNPNDLSDKKMLQYSYLRIVQFSQSISEKTKYLEKAYNISKELLCDKNLFTSSIINDFKQFSDQKEANNKDISMLLSSYKKTEQINKSSTQQVSEQVKDDLPKAIISEKSLTDNSLKNLLSENKIENSTKNNFNTFFNPMNKKKKKPKKNKLKYIAIGSLSILGGFVVNSLIAKNQERKSSSKIKLPKSTSLNNTKSQPQNTPPTKTQSISNSSSIGETLISTPKPSLKSNIGTTTNPTNNKKIIYYY